MCWQVVAAPLSPRSERGTCIHQPLATRTPTAVKDEYNLIITLICLWCSVVVYYSRAVHMQSMAKMNAVLITAHSHDMTTSAPVGQLCSSAPPPRTPAVSMRGYIPAGPSVGASKGQHQIIGVLCRKPSKSIPTYYTSGLHGEENQVVLHHLVDSCCTSTTNWYTSHSRTTSGHCTWAALTGSAGSSVFF